METQVSDFFLIYVVSRSYGREGGSGPHLRWYGLATPTPAHLSAFPCLSITLYRCYTY